MGFFDKVWDKATDFLHGVTGMPTADDKRNASRMVSDQMNAYKKQTEVAEQVVAQKRQEGLANRRRMDEKQVNAVRSRLGGGGSFMGSGTSDLPDTLGA